MSFILRQVIKRDGAPDIVREKKLAAAAPVIGRGSDSDIPLTDLAASLRHARMTLVAPGRVVVEALGEESFESNGHFVHRAELALAMSPTLGFGNHVLTLSAGEDGNVLVLATMRESHVVATSDQPDSFALRHALFDQRRLAWFLFLGILACCLLLPVGLFLIGHGQQRTIAAAADRQWSSGPLSPGHHFLEKNCEACHQQAFVTVKDSACLSCHQAGADGRASLQQASLSLRLGSPFAPDPAADHAPHDRLMTAMPPDPNLARRINSWVAETFSHPNNRCASCHIEHIGNGRVQAGKPRVTADQVRHSDCRTCHAGMATRLPDTKIPDVPDWGHHPDFRPVITVGFRGNQPILQKIALSVAPKEKSGLIFGHDVHLAVAGGVARQAIELGKAGGYGAPLTCASCHRPTPDGGFVPIEMKRDCGACHSLAFAGRGGAEKMLPHGHPDQVVAALKAYFSDAPSPAARPEAFLTRPGQGGVARTGVDQVALALHAVFAPGGTCATCHAVTGPAPQHPAYGIAPVRMTQRYLSWGEFDHNVPAHHQDAQGAPNCQSCHHMERSTDAGNVMLPRITDCAACHGKTKAQVSTPAGGDCAECHGFHNPGRVRGAARDCAGCHRAYDPRQPLEPVSAHWLRMP